MDLMSARWHRLFAGGVCGGLFAVFALAIASVVRLEGTSTARDWFTVASMGFGFALGFPTGVAIYAYAARRRTAVFLPRARLRRRDELRSP